MAEQDTHSIIASQAQTGLFARLLAQFTRGYDALGEHRGPVALFALALVIALLIAFLPAERPSAQPKPEESTAGINVEAFSVLPGQASDAPVLGEPAEPMDDARAKNAAIAFVPGPIEPANPFKFSGSALDVERATHCLALAAMAEAGPSDIGQRAVIQVILNRTRHPAFARTVCGVVFQGSERRTGCQFSFTCDGSLARRYGDEAWRMARNRAVEGLRGYVYAPVGTATHYHTDWVFPYWSPKLEKLARVETHLFFRWPGFWGRKAAARMGYNGGEADFMAAAPTADASQSLSALPTGLPTAAPSIASMAPPIAGGELVMRDPSGKANFVLIGGEDADQALALSRKLCTDPGTCRVMGWGERSAIPTKFPVPATARATLKFSYARDPAGTEITLYNCDLYQGLPRERCIPRAR
jgi:spore germination cell wall hydrolase CwlJ-like protein